MPYKFIKDCFICSLLAKPHHEGAAYFMRDIIRDSVISYNLGP